MTDLVWTPYPDPNNPVLFDARGHRRTASLFLETSQDENRTPLFTLKDYETKGYISAYNLYMDSVDEYDAAMKMVGCMTHWRKLLRSKWFMSGDPDKYFTGLESWRRDMQARDASRAKHFLQKMANDGDRSAAQFLLNYATKGSTAGLVEALPKATKRRGAQSKGDVIDLSKRFEDLMENER